MDMKKTASTKNLMDFEHNLCVLAMIVLVLGGLVFAYKFFKTKNAWQMQSATALQSMDKARMMNADEGAQMVALALEYPAATPLYKQPKDLQAYVMAVGKQTGRDLVVVDTNKNIWADVVAKNVGAKYQEDKKNEVTSTINDGSVRNFVEQGVDYPNGIAQTVVPLKDAAGKTVGAVIFSSSNTLK